MTCETGTCRTKLVAAVAELTAAETREADFRVEGWGGSVVLVRPLNEATEEFLAETTDGQWFGGALAVEPRYVEGLVEGLVEHGFEGGF